MASVSVADMRAHIAFLRDVHVHSIRDESSSLYFDHPPREPPPVQGFRAFCASDAPRSEANVR